MKKWQHRLHTIIFEADTPAGKLFDILLMCVILLSVLCVALESVASIDLQYHNYLKIAEWVFTVLFSIEYLLRIFAVKKTIELHF